MQESTQNQLETEHEHLTFNYVLFNEIMHP